MGKGILIHLNILYLIFVKKVYSSFLLHLFTMSAKCLIGWCKIEYLVETLRVSKAN